MKLEVEIETFDKKLDFDLFDEKKSLSSGMQKSIGEGISVIYKGTRFRKSVGFPDIIRVVLEIGEDVVIGIGAGLISAWLYDKLKERKVERLRIERTEVRIDKGEIERILIEKIEKA